ncbi:ribonuclease R [Hyphomonas jannaschiana VP2]|uniref:Ribonuclease R n=2 Tax=Hyphomonas jannaschiana TaxID=86 RepID=A0A059FAP6_9PROT|nr:ribonuclease R [Hyphomonas jannaschiana VP2]
MAVMTFPDRQTVLDFLRENPSATTKQEIARGLKLKGKERATLREILKEMEADGTLERTGKRAWAQADRPPPTGVVEFTHLDDDGELIGKSVGDNGLFGPEIRYAGPSGKPKAKAPAVGDRALCKISERDGEWLARAITVFEKRLSDKLVGLYSQTTRGGKVVPSSRKEKREFVIQEADRNGAEEGDLVIAEPKPVGRRQYGPAYGIVTEVIGHITDPRSASLLAIHAHDIPTEFPEAALEQARDPHPAAAEREDLTAVQLITIDPHDARDHDDAVWAEELKDGWRVIVAIADVAAYVTEGSALDKEALKRGNSTYFPDRVVPMLPFELSADECSLREGELRRCMAVEMVFDKSGTKRSHRFIRGMMKSAAKLSYEEAQAAIDGKPGGKAGELLDSVLKPLWGAYAALSKARDKRSPLDLDLPERRIVFDENGEIQGIIAKERLEAHRLIEEFMIQANVAAAESLEKANSPLVYRVHDVPTDAKIAAFAEFLQTIDIKWHIGERPQTHKFNKLLEDIRGGVYDEMVTQMVLRSQAQAIYSEENLGHFGLNLAKYAHFTSPIRRYADLIVHRALIRALKLGPDGLSDQSAARLEEIAEHITTTERRSMAAEREATDRYLAIFLADRVGAEFEGRIMGVTGAGLFVALAGSGADGFVPISSISDDYWMLDQAAMEIYARGSGKTYSMGQTVRVRLKEVTPLQGGLLLEMLSEPQPAPKGRAEARKAADAGGRSPRGRGGPPRRGKPKFNKKTLPKHKRRSRK